MNLIKLGFKHTPSYFITGNLPAETKQELPFTTYPRKQSHMTLLYIGETKLPEEHLKDLVHSIAETHKDTILKYKGYSLFGKRHATPVIELHPNKRIMDLRHDLTKILPREDSRAWHPHIALAYNNPHVTYRAIPIQSVPIKEISLMKDDQGKFERVTTVPLQKRNLLDKLLDYVR
jgi:2'-5' RNA ligase